MIYDMPTGLLVIPSSGEGKVVQAAGAEHCVMDAVALQVAVAKDLPGLHPGEDVLDAGTDLVVRAVGREIGSAFLAAGRDDQTGALVAGVRDDRGLADGLPCVGQLPRLAVVAVAGRRPPYSDDESGVGIDDDLVVGGVPVVLRLLGDGVVAGGHQGAHHDHHGVLAPVLQRRPPGSALADRVRTFAP